jgi:hypothetical protein
MDKEKRFVLGHVATIVKMAPEYISITKLKYGYPIHFIYASEDFGGWVFISRTLPGEGEAKRLDAFPLPSGSRREGWVPGGGADGRYAVYEYKDGVFRETYQRINFPYAEPIRRAQRSDAGYVYFILNAEKGLVKIGRTNNVGRRLFELRSHNSDAIELIYSIKSEAATKTESVIQKRFAGDRIRGEWFSFTDEMQDFIKGEKDNVTRGD